MSHYAPLTYFKIYLIYCLANDNYNTLKNNDTLHPYLINIKE